MLQETILLLCFLLVARPLMVSSDAHVRVGNFINIPPNQYPPCNADHPQHCLKPVKTNHTEHCNEANRCRTHLLFLQDGSGSQFLAVLVVEGGPANLTDAVLTKATAAAFSRCLVDNKKDNSSQSLRISVDISGVDSHISAQLQDAASEGITEAGMNFELASTTARNNNLSAEKEAPFSPFDGTITIRASRTDKHLIFKLFTIVKDFGEANMKDILDSIPVIFRKLWVEGHKDGGVNEGHEEAMPPQPPKP